MNKALDEIRSFIDSEMAEIDREFFSAVDCNDDERARRIVVEQTRLVDVNDALNALKSALDRYRNAGE